MTLEQIDVLYEEFKRAELEAKRAKRANGYRLQPLYKCCRTCSHSSKASSEDDRKCVLLANDRWDVNTVEDMAVCYKYWGQSEVAI